ncbi:hypothetical protein BJ912DRAFT_562884 [Pholiota molesta]|nr:hypothetical protein BJ912DRAFT_562884 [Pholiota molesta]
MRRMRISFIPVPLRLGLNGLLNMLAAVLLLCCIALHVQPVIICYDGCGSVSFSDSDLVFPRAVVRCLVLYYIVYFLSARSGAGGDVRMEVPYRIAIFLFLLHRLVLCLSFSPGDVGILLSYRRYGPF